jgi:predicted SAM-dependent methyltransferase
MLQRLKNAAAVRSPFLRRVAKRRARPTAATPRKLHLGCGDIRIDGYCNVDISFLPTVDIIDDVIRLRKFEKSFADQIYACHVLEHLSHDEVPRALARWFEVLRPGGELRISVPDIDRIVKVYHKNWQHFQTRGNTPWIGLLYGGQTDPYDYHKTGFNFCWMHYLLEAAGFDEISEYPHQPHFIPGVRDASLASEPFGEFISLNIKARKPA